MRPHQTMWYRLMTMADATQLESVTCTSCGNLFRFDKGTIAQEKKNTFRCASCSTSTLESNVEKGLHKGKSLLID